MNIPDTILNMDASGCNTNVQQQADEDTVEVSAQHYNTCRLFVTFLSAVVFATAFQSG